MTDPQKVTKEQLLQTIDNLRKNPNDRIRILGDGGITILGAGLGATAVTAVAAPSIFGLTTVASWLGVTLVGATPIGWVVAGTFAGAGAAYGISRLIRGGAISEGRKKELLQQYLENLKDFEAKERAGSISDDDKDNFLFSLRELIDKDIFSPEKAKQLIDLVEQGRIPLSQAVSIIQDLLREKHTNKLDEIKKKAEEHVGSLEQQMQKNSDILKDLICEIESKNEVIKQHNEFLATGSDCQ